jgi:hypothetical protein
MTVLKVTINKVLLATVIKKSKHIFDAGWHVTNFVSFERDKLVAAIEQYYEINFIKNESDDFPWFTDGGFRYVTENDNWIFEATAHLVDIIQ